MQLSLCSVFRISCIFPIVHTLDYDQNTISGKIPNSTVLSSNTTAPMRTLSSAANSNFSNIDGSLSFSETTATTTEIDITPEFISPSEAPPVISVQACLLIERGSDSLLYNYDKSAGAIDLAVDYVNDQILHPIKMSLKTVYYDIGSTCVEKNYLVSYAMDLRNRNVTCNVYIGLGCAYNTQTLYDVAAYYDIPIIGCPAAGVGVQAPLSEYPYMSRISITHTNTAAMLLRFLNTQNYNSLLIIQDQDISFYQQLGLVVEQVFKQNSDLYASTYQPISSLNMSDELIKNYFRSATTRSRVFLFLTDANTTRRLMLNAFDVGLCGGDYVFIAVELFKSASWGTFTWKQGNDRDNDARLAYQTILLFALDSNTDPDYDHFEALVKKASAKRKTYSYQYAADEPVDLVVSHFYDSIVYYASVLKDLHDGQRSIFSIRNVLAIMNSNYSFNSPVHGQVNLDVNGDRIFSYQVKNFNPDSGKFDVSFGLPALTDGMLILGDLQWPGENVLPANTPFCGFDGKNPLCGPKPLTAGVLTVAALLPTLIVAIGCIIGYFSVKRLIHKRSDPYWWRILTSELTLTDNPGFQSRAISSRSKGNISLSKKSLTADDTKSVVTGALTIRSTRDMGYLLFSNYAIYKDAPVSLRPFPEPLQRMTPAVIVDLSVLKHLQHNNLQAFYGIAVNDENLCQFAVAEVCQKGSVTSLINLKRLNLDWHFKNALMKDISAGMAYLHSTKVMSHGDLSAHTCLVESRFIVKITDYGLTHFRDVDDMLSPTINDTNREFSKLLWRAPELLRRPILGGTQKGDVYSFAILLQQIILRSAPFETSVESASERDDKDDRAKEFVLEVKRGAIPPLRPVVPVSSCPVTIHELMDSCWDEQPMLRPPFQKVKDLLAKYLGKSGENIVDHLIRRMEQYATELEHEADEKMKQFMDEKARSEALLSGMLPKAISEALSRGQIVYPEVYQSTTVQFSDISGFLQVLAEAPTPFHTVEIMNMLYYTCDHVIEAYDVYKVETVGDAYLLVSGLPVKNGIRHAGIMSSLAIELRKDVGSLVITSSPEVKLRLRVGIHSGPCVASVIGTRMPRYCLFGDTVNTASRMESHGEAGKIQLSSTTKELLDIVGNYFVSPRGEITVKGKGSMMTFWLVAHIDKLSIA